MRPDLAFWTDPETVERFASREPDRHLVDRLEALDAAEPLRVLDLGAAGGRNSEHLVRAGHYVVAVDLSRPMLARTRQRTHALRPRAGIVQACFTALPFPSGIYDAVAAIGVYHQAWSDEVLRGALAETRRVLRAGGWVLMSVFSTAMLPADSRRVPGQRYVYSTTQGTVCRLSVEDISSLLAAHGFAPLRPIDVRPGPADSDRVTLVGLFTTSDFA